MEHCKNEGVTLSVQDISIQNKCNIYIYIHTDIHIYRESENLSINMEMQFLFWE